MASAPIRDYDHLMVSRFFDQYQFLKVQEDQFDGSLSHSLSLAIHLKIPGQDIDYDNHNKTLPAKVLNFSPLHSNYNITVIYVKHLSTCLFDLTLGKLVSAVWEAVQ